MAESSIKQRIQLVGADDVKRSFQEMGKAGEQAFKQIDQASKSVKFDKEISQTIDNTRIAFGQLGTVARSAARELNQAASTEIVRGFGATGSAATKLGDAFSALGGLLLRFAGPAGALFVAAGAIAVFTKKALDGVSELRDAAKELDTSVPNLAGFRNIGQQAGLTDQNVSAALLEVGKRIREIRPEVERATQTFQTFTANGEQATVTIRKFGDGTAPVSKAAAEFAGSLNRLGLSLGDITDKNNNLTFDGLIKLARALNTKFSTSFEKDIEIKRLGLEEFSKILKGSTEDIDRFERAGQTGAAAAPNQNLLSVAEKYSNAVKDLKAASSDLGSELGKVGDKLAEVFGPGLINTIELIRKGIDATKVAAEGLNALLEKLRPTGDTPKVDDAKLAASGFTVGVQGLKYLSDYYSLLGSLWNKIKGDSAQSVTQIDDADAAAQRLKKTIEGIPKLNGFNPSLTQPGANDNGTVAPAPNKSSWQDYETQGLGAIEKIRAAAVELGTTIDQSISGAFRAVEDSAQSASSVIQQASVTMKDSLQSVIQTASAVTSSVTGDVGTTRAATGGYIVGPGTSTSDSIPARLSAGEFVVRAAAVKRYGVDLLHALNGMRLSMPNLRNGIPGFAMGGLVAPLPALAGAGPASAGRPLVLNIGGDSFALSASSDVADKLARYAAKRVVASAGRRPSWVGG